MADDDRIGWEIDGTFYTHDGAESLLHGDFALIREVTGLTLEEFDRGDDPIATETGWIAVALWHANPDLRRAQVVRMVERLSADAAKRVGWEVPVEDDAAVPPTADDSLALSGVSSSTSVAPLAETGSRTEPAEQTPEPSIPNGSGDPLLATGVTSSPETLAPLRSVAG